MTNTWNNTSFGDFKELNYDDNPSEYLKKIIEGRFFGTGVHLTNPSKRIYCISYSQFKIKGIKGVLTRFIRNFYGYIEDVISLDPSVYSSKYLEQGLIEISNDFLIDNDSLKQRFNKLKEPIENWNNMDILIKSGVIINAFFEEFETSQIILIEDLNRLNKLKERIQSKTDYFNHLLDDPNKRLLNYLNDLQNLRIILGRNEDAENLGTTSKKIDYYLEDFGFVFRARIYSAFTSFIFYNGAFSGIIHKLDELLGLLYEDYFINKLRGAEIRELKERYKKFLPNYLKENEKDKNNTRPGGDFTEIKTSMSSQSQANPNDNSREQELAELKEALKNTDAEKIKSALELINKKRYIELADDLEYLFNNPDLDISKMAFDIYLNLKNLNESP
ncbi:MAG: hypothetical protein ACTSU2_17305 [Promethearchaeota archaeon]